MSKNFYVTTPIYYPSAKPHMGHAYSSIVADFFARFKRNDGFSVQFLTGTDEHGLKIQRSAEKQGMEPKEFCNLISKTFKDLSKTLNLSNTDFIRTTEDRHIKSVQNLWSLLEANGQIYMSKYEGWYSVSDEAFYQEDEIDQAIAAIDKGLKKGKLKNPGFAQLTLGQALFEKERFDEAREVFNKATQSKSDAVKKTARSWLKYTDSEQERVKNLNLRRESIS